MDRPETAALLRDLAALDHWFLTLDAHARADMLDGWAAMLGAVPAETARQAARSHYAQPRARSIQPGDIIAAWKRTSAHEDRRRRDDERHAVVDPMAVLEQAGAPSWFREQVTKWREFTGRRAKGEDIFEPPSPPTRPITEAERANDRWWRKCAHERICACAHTECRDGVLDVEVADPIPGNPDHVRVQRCPLCYDAALMAAEGVGAGRRR